ncbi:MAG TPA: hypothetical protein VJU83_11535, partial [Burkholderiales bacterium]|nr:hypothetical protein [Burkholderiales bacterium]
GTRITPSILEQGGDYPAIAYMIIDEAPVNSLTSYSGLTRYAVLIECSARTYDEARAIYRAVLDRMAVKTSAFSALRESGSGADNFDEALRLHRVGALFGVWYRDQ